MLCLAGLHGEAVEQIEKRLGALISIGRSNLLEDGGQELARQPRPVPGPEGVQNGQAQVGGGREISRISDLAIEFG